MDISDAIAVLDHLFGEGDIACSDAADANDDGGVNIADVVTVLSRMFEGAPPLPAPSDISRGPDPTMDGLGCG